MTFFVTNNMNFITLYCLGTAAAAKPKVQSTFQRDIKTTKDLKEPTLCPISILHLIENPKSIKRLSEPVLIYM